MKHPWWRNAIVILIAIAMLIPVILSLAVMSGVD